MSMWNRRGKSEGELSFPEYSKRPQCRNVRMQHVLPSRNVCVAYHGMTVPLPVASLCSALAPPAKRSTCTKHPQLKAAKDPQLKAALCNGASVDGRLVNSDVENDRDGELREDKNEKWMEQQPCISENRCEQEVALQSTAPADPKSCVGVTSEEKKSEKAYDCNDMISSSPEGGLASVNGSSKVTMWSSVGRGKSLRQLVSTIKHNPGPIGKRHPSLMSHHCSYVPTSQLEEGKKDPESLSPQTHEDTTTEEKMPLLICADDEQTSTELSACAPLPMLQAQLGLASSPSLGDRDVRQDKKENTVQNTSRSQRKPKVSLAIQFKGAATPVGLSPSEQIHSVSPVGLMRPKDFEIQATSGKGRSGEMLNLTSSVDDQVISDDEGCLELDRKIDQGPKQLYTQDQRCNGSLEDRQIFPSQGNDGSDRVQKHNGEKREVSLQSSSENSTSISCSFLSSLTSSSEDELGFVESRLGRKTGDLEKSIAMHQRNIHRNQAELKRVQKRSQAMGEELARELCDLPCTESYGDDEDVVQELTHDRVSGVNQVIGLHTQFLAESEALKKREEDYKFLLEQGSKIYGNDKLASMELKLELESLELEGKLRLAKLEAKFLQSKTELLYD